MKIIMLHGDDTVKIHERVQKFVGVARERDWDVYKITDKTQNISEVLRSTGLFAKEKLVIFENANLINTKLQKFLKSKNEQLTGTLVIVNEGYLSKTLVKSLPEIEKAEEYKLPKLIWNLLDSFFPGNIKNSLLLLNEVVKKEPVEFAFSLLGKLLRDLYWVKTGPATLLYPDWRVSKLKRQALKFKENQLKDLIDEFSEIDVRVKTSQDNLKSLLDFTIASRLE